MCMFLSFLFVHNAACDMPHVSLTSESRYDVLSLNRSKLLQQQYASDYKTKEMAKLYVFINNFIFMAW